MRQTTSIDGLLQLLEHPNFVPAMGMVVAIVAIVSAAVMLIVVTKLWLSHRQRMALIAQGMHPDAYGSDLVDEPRPPARVG